jgi:cell filamentation protein
MKVDWRWEEKDLGFRFRAGASRTSVEYYQAASQHEYYVVPANQRKLEKTRMEELAANAIAPPSPKVVAIPWRNYQLGWDWVETDDGIPLNWAGCLEREEIERREDEGVARAMDTVVDLVSRDVAAPLSIALIRQIHMDLMGTIYPFAGEWRTVELHKGEGAVKWPLPPVGIQPLMDVFEKEVLNRSPFLSNDDEAVSAFSSEVMNELLAIHPFREGNGRTAFILGNLILMQNDLLPLDLYDPRRHQDAYYAACEAGRLRKDYRPLAGLISEWEEEALSRWENFNGE